MNGCHIKDIMYPSVDMRIMIVHPRLQKERIAYIERHCVSLLFPAM